MVVTVSRMKAAQLIGRACYSTASRQIAKMKKLGLIVKDDIREFKLNSTEDFSTAVFESNKVGKVIKRKEGVVLKLSNILEVAHRELGT